MGNFIVYQIEFALDNGKSRVELFLTGVDRVKPNKLINSMVFYSPEKLVIQD